MRRLTEALHMLERVVRNGNLRRLELAWAASNLANRASAVAVAVFAYETGGTRAVGLILFVRLTAAAFAAPWLGLVADRHPRRTVLILSELVRSTMFGVMAVLELFGTSRVAVYILAVLVALGEPLFRSASAALAPALVGVPEELTATNVIASGVESVGLFGGPAIGALLLAVSSTGVVFAVSAGALILTAALIARIGVAGNPPPERDHAHVHALLVGWRTIVSEPGLRIVIGLYSTQTLVAGMLNVLVVVLAIELLGVGTAGVGWLSAMVGVGALLGILVAAGIAGRRRLSGYFGLGLLLWGVPLMLIAAWPTTGSALVLLTLVGVGNTLVDVTGVTLMQRGAADAVLGRVFGAFEALVFLTMGLGALLAPAFVSAVGVRGALLAAGLILLVAVVPLWRPLVTLDAAAPPPSDRITLLQRVSIFSPLPPPELERLAKALVEVRREGGARVFSEGATGDRFYVIAEGSAAVESGGRRVGRLGTGDFFGEVALLRDVPRTATVRALTALRLYALDRETFVATVTGHPASAEEAGSIVAARLPAPISA